MTVWLLYIGAAAANFSWGGGGRQDRLIYMFARNLCARTAQWPEQLHVRARKDLRNVHARCVKSNAPTRTHMLVLMLIRSISAALVVGGIAPLKEIWRGGRPPLPPSAAAPTTSASSLS